MTMMNGVTQNAKYAPVLLRRCANNVITALAIGVRPAKYHLTKVLSLPVRQLAIAAGVAFGIFLFGMFFVDAAVIRGVARLPRWVVDFFDVITDFGKSGWFLWPLGVLFLGLAALPFQSL